MKKCLCYLLVLIFFFIYGSISAQTDSAYFDLGRVKLRKDFTQHITIKGRDLEHMPFARVSDALAPWLQGTLSTRTGLVFVVDGNLVNDVDAWSIHDIEEITLVQNAVGQVNGTLNRQQLVLVTTKRNQTSPKGLTIAGSSYLTTMDFQNDIDDLESEKNLYHQYHIDAWQKRGRLSFGASANWLRDVSPMAKEIFKMNKTHQLNRFRFNGWLEAELAEGHSLTFRLNVVPQTISFDYSLLPALYTETRDAKSKNTTINPSLHLSNRIAKDLLHELDLSYLTSSGPQDNRSEVVYTPPATGNQESIYHAKLKNRNVLVRDRISYTKTLGQWQLQPSVSLTYRSTKQETDYTITTRTNGVVNSTNYYEFSQKSESWVLTPALNLSYRNAFNITGGISYKLKEDNTVSEDRIYPFVSTSLDLLRIGRPDNPNSLKIFGSFAMPGDFADRKFQQADLQYDPDPLYSNSPSGPVVGGSVLFTPYPEDPTLRSYQAGAVFALPADKLQVSYNYDNRRYLGYMLVPLPMGTGWDYALYYPDYTYSTHRLAVLARVIEKGQLRWLSGINATGLKYTLKDEEDFPGWDDTRDANHGKILWTGGFTNRLQYKNFSFGFDLLYQLNEQRNSGPFFTSFESTNTFRLNSIYAGYSFKIANSKPLEVYLSGRNCLQSNESQFFDNRRYYGAGFRLQL